jgi:hypothetical protein
MGFLTRRQDLYYLRANIIWLRSITITASFIVLANLKRYIITPSLFP